ncbi:hypothetical protein MSG28_010419 [Choristoneura fumiferana]|uniref:Uncharacterized protein n=1 Tax=Choristoneura fumiferana TaxID=7141 RepID=A0ACC0KL84_CHOFU|nr:hypothetical protein MSG28_010419 [Choristoneura fumiferana]
MQILLTVDNITINVCLGLTFVIYFALLSAFFWLNVMCFDIWWTFSGKRGLSLERWSMRARFCAYAAYAFGFPTGLTVLLAALEFSGRSKLIYLYGPIVILCIANMLFTVMGINWILEVVSALYPQANNVWRFVDAYNVMIGFFIFIIIQESFSFYHFVSRFNEMFQISQSDSGDLRTIGNRDVKNWKEYQQQRGSLDTVRTSICCDSDNIRTTKTSSF